jgi:hypothetical protein
MPPHKIMIIRHAEKPLGGVKVSGVNEYGAADPDSLIVQGWQRAGALVPFFVTPWKKGIACPDAIYASGSKNGSRRSIETVLPLATRLHCPFVTHFSKDEVALAIAEVMRQTGVILMAWEHKNIPSLVRALPHTPDAPDKFPSERYDLVWVLDRQETSWIFYEQAQCLLKGDRPS